MRRETRILSAVPAPALGIIGRSGDPHPRTTLVRIRLWGSIDATTVAGRDVLPHSRRARAILAYLALARGKAVSRTKIASILWDRVPEAQSRASLRQALSELTTSWKSTPKLLEATRETLCLHVDKCSVDVLALEEAREYSRDMLLHDLPLSGPGKLLEDLDGISESFDEWLALQRSKVEAQLRDLHERRLAHLIENAVSPALRARAARELIQFDPTHERAWRALMTALIEMGDRAQAMYEYQRCCESLRELLDIEPSRETKELHNAIKTKPPAAKLVTAAEMPQPALPRRSGRIRIGVLSFTDGPLDNSSLPWSLSIDCSAALSRFGWLDVIAPMALTDLQPNKTDWPSKLNEFTLDYVLQGRLKPIGDKIRFQALLLKTHELARPVWSDAYELPTAVTSDTDIGVAVKLAARINPAILLIEGMRSDNRNESDPMSLVLQAIPLMYSMDSQNYARAGLLLAKAVHNWPDDSMAAAWRAFWHMFNVAHGWSKSPIEEYAEAERLSQRAIELDPENAEALGIYAQLCCYVHHDFEAAADCFDRSLNLNPSLAFVWALSATNSCYMGDPQDALKRLQRYRDLTPLDPYFRLFETIYVVAYTFARDYERAAAIGRRAVRANPNFTNVYKPLLAALGHLGRIEEAALYLRELLRQEPTFSIRHFAAKYPFRREEDRAQYIAGLRKVGVPET